MKPIVGGGPKKVLYTLSTVKRIGLLNSAKALNSHNACKACGLGMGGQQGGMTNEAGEFPSVCNKSIQAQSSDIQAPIPHEVFKHSMDDFRQLSAQEIEALGRLNTPLLKAKGQHHFTPIDWDIALDKAAERFRQSAPEKSFFYSSGRSSNEAGFILQLLARLYGTNNVNNCSYYCHQATGVGLANTIGTGTATVELDDLGGCDCIFVIGANPSSNHPRFIHQLKKCRDRGGVVIIINPAKEPGLVKFAVPKSPSSMLKGGDWIASEYLQPNIGSDQELINGIAKAIFERNGIAQDFIDKHTHGFDEYQKSIEALSWEHITETTGIDPQQIKTVATLYSESKHTVFAWGMGITHHQHGVENVEAISNLALLRAMIGKVHAGLLPLRGHSNVQGIGTIGVKPVLAATVLDAIEQQLKVELPKNKGKDTLACLEAAVDNQIDNALIMGGNLLQATPNSEWAKQAMDAIDFKLFLTTTLNKGHVEGNDDSECIILPVTARDEEWQATTQESMFNYVRLSDGGIHRLDNIKPESHILCELGQRLVTEDIIDFNQFKNHDTTREAIASIVPGMAALKDIGIAKKEFHINNIYEQKDSYRGTQERWSVLLNSQDILELGINPGDYVDLTSQHGQMDRVKTYVFNLPKGNVMAYYPEANALIGLERDPRSQTPAFKHVAIDIKPSII